MALLHDEALLTQPSPWVMWYALGLITSIINAEVFAMDCLLTFWGWE